MPTIAIIAHVHGQRPTCICQRPLPSVPRPTQRGSIHHPTRPGSRGRRQVSRPLRMLLLMVRNGPLPRERPALTGMYASFGAQACHYPQSSRLLNPYTTRTSTHKIEPQRLLVQDAGVCYFSWALHTSVGGQLSGNSWYISPSGLHAVSSWHSRHRSGWGRLGLNSQYSSAVPVHVE